MCSRREDSGRTRGVAIGWQNAALFPLRAFAARAKPLTLLRRLLTAGAEAAVQKSASFLQRVRNAEHRHAEQRRRRSTRACTGAHGDVAAHFSCLVGTNSTIPPLIRAGRERCTSVPPQRHVPRLARHIQGTANWA